MTLNVPGVQVQPRSSWQDPARPVTGPARRAPMRQGVVHWEGDKVGVPLNVAAYLRAMQAGYLSTRDYSLGYGYAAVSQAGHPSNGSLWEIRGDDINMASNPGDKVPGNANNWTGSVIILGHPDDHITPAAASSVRALFHAWHTSAGTSPVRPIPHSDLDYTACCGDRYRSDIAAGRLDPTPISPQPLDPTGGPPVFIKLVQLEGTDPVYAQYSGGYKTWVSTKGILAAFKSVGAGDVEEIPAEMTDLFASTGPILGPVPAGVDAWGVPK